MIPSGTYSSADFILQFVLAAQYRMHKENASKTHKTADMELFILQKRLP